MTPVKVLHRSNGVALVEWTEGKDIYRGYVPVAQVENGQCEEMSLNMAPSYGMQFRYLFDVNADALKDAVERELHRNNIWTAQDFVGNYEKARRAACDAMGDMLASLLAQAKEDIDANRKVHS